MVGRPWAWANLAERVELRSALAQYRTQAVRGSAQTQDLQNTLVAELEAVRKNAERANAMGDQLHFEREKTARLGKEVDDARRGELAAKRTARRMQAGPPLWSLYQTEKCSLWSLYLPNGVVLTKFSRYMSNDHEARMKWITHTNIRSIVGGRNPYGRVKRACHPSRVLSFVELNDIL